MVMDSLAHSCDMQIQQDRYVEIRNIAKSLKAEPSRADSSEASREAGTSFVVSCFLSHSLICLNISIPFLYISLDGQRFILSFGKIILLCIYFIWDLLFHFILFNILNVQER